MKYLILWLIIVRVINLFILHISYQGLNKEKIKQNYVNYIAILIKNILFFSKKSNKSSKLQFLQLYPKKSSHEK